MYGTNEHIEKYCVFSLSASELNPCVRMYDILMRSKIKKGDFGVDADDWEGQGLLSKWENMCWRCHKK